MDLDCNDSDSPQYEFIEIINSSHDSEYEEELIDDEISPVSVTICDDIDLLPPLNSNGNSGSLFNLDFAKLIWCSDYMKDIYNSLKELEVNRKIIFVQSPQLSYRPDLLKLIKKTAENSQLARTTVHLAVYLLDIFMDTFEVIETNFNAVALTCVLVASKIEERDQKIPRFEKLNRMVDTPYKPNDYKDIELQLLDCCSWYLMYPTAATFLESFLTRIVTIHDFHSLEYIKACSNDNTFEFNTFEELLSSTNKVVFDYLDVILYDFDLINETPSLISAACIAAARSHVGIEPVWNDRLCRETYYTYSDIKNVVRKLLSLTKNFTEISRNDLTPDSGVYVELSQSDGEDASPQTSARELTVPYKKIRKN